MAPGSRPIRPTLKQTTMDQTTIKQLQQVSLRFANPAPNLGRID